MSIPLLAAKPKATSAAVQGRITVVAEDGAKVGQWGGTECYLSRENGLGPCLVVTTISNKKRRTCFPLVHLHRVLSFHVNAGKLTVLMPHEQRKMVSIFVETVTDQEELKLMAAMLQDRSSWTLMERNVSKASKGTAAAAAGSRGRASISQAVVSVADHYDDVFEEDAPGADAGRDSDVQLFPSQGGEADLSDADAFEEEARNAAQMSAVMPDALRPSSTASAPPASAFAQQQATLARMQDSASGSELAAIAGALHEVHRPAADEAELGFDIPTSDKNNDSQSDATSRAGAGNHVMTSSRARVGAAPTALLQDCPQFSLIADAISQGTNVFITGPPGTGKTAFVSYLQQTREAHVLQQGREAEGKGKDGSLVDADASFALLARKSVAVTAATGHAARFLGGATLSAFSGVPVHGSAHGVEAIVDKILTLRSHRAVLHNWLSTEVLVIDDVNEIPAHVFTLVAEVGKRVRQAAFVEGFPVSGVEPRQGGDDENPHDEHARATLARPFGGVQLVVLGDFMGQPPPLSRAGEEVLAAFAASAWPLCELQCIWLTPDVDAMRQQLLLEESHGGTQDAAAAVPPSSSSAPQRAMAERLVLYQQFLQDVREGDYTVAVDDVVVACTSNYRDWRLAEWEAKRSGTQAAARDLATPRALEPVAVVASANEADHVNAQRLSEVLDGHRDDKKAQGGGGVAEAKARHLHHFTSEDYAAHPGTNMDAEVNLPSSLALCRGAQVMLLASPPTDFAVVRRGKGRGGSATPQRRRRREETARTEFWPSYGCIGLVVDFVQPPRRSGSNIATTNASIAAGRKTQRGAEENGLPVVRFFRSYHEGSGEKGGEDDSVDIVMDKITLHVYETQEAIGSSHDRRTAATTTARQDKLVLSRTQMPLRLAFALPVSALRNTPMLPAIRVRVDASFFTSATAAAVTSGAKSRRGRGEVGEEEEQEQKQEGDDGSDAGQEEELLRNQWGHLFTALAKVPTTDRLYLERFHRKVLKRTLHTDALRFYSSLFPRSSEEEQALREKRFAEKAILDRRRRERKTDNTTGASATAAATSAAPRRSPSHAAKRAREEVDEDCAFLAAAGMDGSRPSPSAGATALTKKADTGTMAAADVAPPLLPANAESETGKGPHASLGLAADSITGDSFHMGMLTQDSMISTVTDFADGSQVRAMVRDLLMDDDEEA